MVAVSSSRRVDMHERQRRGRNRQDRQKIKLETWHTSFAVSLSCLFVGGGVADWLSCWRLLACLLALLVAVVTDGVPAAAFEEMPRLRTARLQGLQRVNSSLNK